jgi:hypothetical protein
MEISTPYIVYDIDINTIQPDSFAMKLAQKFPCIGYNKQDILVHQSPEITCIHSQKYLDNISHHPTAMLSAINNNILMSLYPNCYSKNYFTQMLNDVMATVIATERVIAVRYDPERKPNYAISCGQGYSFAGHAQGSLGDAYAAIPIAAAYALRTNAIRRILIIDDNITEKTRRNYYANGNGAIFCPQDNPHLDILFKGKIITHDNIPPHQLWDFVANPDKCIDFAFYNININDAGMTDEREKKICSLFYNFIPTVFILSGDKNRYHTNACSIIEYIAQSAQIIIPIVKEISFKTTDFDDADKTSSSSNDNKNQMYRE